MRVKVWSGDQSEYLGLGTYLDDVTVYFIAMPDGSLRSCPKAGERPTPEQIAETGGSLIESEENPKIVLDSGEVVYGCQVWWNPADPVDPNGEINEKKKRE
jgi:hypothetical protein